MTLFSVYDRSGCVGRCDAKCYNALHSHCTCVCKGKNHGCGELRAQWNTFDGLLKELSDETPELQIEVSDEARQVGFVFWEHETKKI